MPDSTLTSTNVKMEVERRKNRKERGLRVVDAQRGPL
jgi:hypothetical protein